MCFEATEEKVEVTSAQAVDGKVITAKASNGLVKVTTTRATGRKDTFELSYSEAYNLAELITAAADLL